MAEAANQAVNSEIEALRIEVKGLTDIVSELARSATDRAARSLQDAVGRAKDSASGKAEALVASGKRARKELSKRVDPMTAELSSRAQHNPVAALCLAAGVGFLIALVLRQGK
jgi:ElaB/YqjD/DUF883 family membrane-anchored ribosome-binding protein